MKPLTPNSLVTMNKLILLLYPRLGFLVKRFTTLIWPLVFLLMLFLSEQAKAFEKLPTDLRWETNNTARTFASEQALPGGIFRTMISDFPPTFRQVGPNANSSFRGFLDVNTLSLIDKHPQTDEYIPALATHWWVSQDNKTAYFKLDPQARWSDGKPVTAEDYLFTLTFMRSPHIVAPWYNNHYSKEIVAVTKYDSHTISVTLGHAKPREDVLMNAAISPIPKHFHQLNKEWVQWANWRIAPTTGPYVIKNFRKGRYIDFVKVKDWWGKNHRYYRHRFNVDRIRIKVIRNLNIAWNLFLKGELDSFGIVLPEYWHERATTKAFDKGWIRKFWFYNERPQPTLGLFINLADPLFKDKRVRKAIAYSLNIDKMNRALLRGDYDRLPGFHSGYGDYSHPNLTPEPFDLAKAETLLEVAGWTTRTDDGIRSKKGQRLSFRVSYSQPIHTPRLALLKEEMKKAGIEMQLQLLTGASAYRHIMEKKHQVAWMGWGAGGRPAYRQHFHSDNAHKPQTNNITNTADPAMDALIEAYRRASKKSERIKLAHQIQTLIAEMGAYIPTYMVPYTREAAWAYLRLPDDIAPKKAEQLFDPMGLGTLWIDPKIKEKIKQKKSLPPETLIDTRYRLGKNP